MTYLYKYYLYYILCKPYNKRMTNVKGSQQKPVMITAYNDNCRCHTNILNDQLF